MKPAAEQIQRIEEIKTKVSLALQEHEGVLGREKLAHFLQETIIDLSKAQDRIRATETGSDQSVASGS